MKRNGSIGMVGANRRVLADTGLAVMEEKGLESSVIDSTDE